MIYCIFFNKKLENFSTHNSCVSTVAGRMLFQKESLNDAFINAKNQNQCVNVNQTDLLNKFNWSATNDCARFLEGRNDKSHPEYKLKSKDTWPIKDQAQKWFESCVTPIFQK